MAGAFLLKEPKLPLPMSVRGLIPGRGPKGNKR